MGTQLDSRESQAAEAIDRLYEQYPDPEISLEFSNRLELLIAVILSAQCTDERVNRVTAELFDRYDGPESYAAADEAELAEAIDSITYYNNKAGYIKSASRDIVALHGGEVPDTMSELTDLARPADLPTARADGGALADEDRTRPHGHRPRRRLEGVHALAHQPRTRHLYRTEPRLLGLRPGGHLSLLETRQRGRSGRR